MVTATQERIKGTPDVKVPCLRDKRVANKGRQASAGEISVTQKLPTIHCLTRGESSFLARFCFSVGLYCEELMRQSKEMRIPVERRSAFDSMSISAMTSGQHM